MIPDAQLHFVVRAGHNGGGEPASFNDIFGYCFDHPWAEAHKGCDPLVKSEKSCELCWKVRIRDVKKADYDFWSIAS